MSQSIVANPRLEAVHLLLRILPAKGEGASLKACLADPRYQQWKNADRGLLFDLCFGVCRYWRLLDGWVSEQMQKPLKASAHDVRLALCCGLYELQFSDRPAHAIVNAWPNICRKLKQPWAAGLCNALLRKASGCDLDDWAKNQPIPVAHNIPDWLFARWENDWPLEAANIASASETSAPLCLRANKRQNDREELVQLFDNKEITTRKARISNAGIYLNSAMPVGAIPGFMTGSCSVQDEAAQLPAQLFELSRPKVRILDACAAPGGKTGQLCELYPDAVIDALEVDAIRLQRVKSNLNRLGLTANLINGDAGLPVDWWDGKPYDAILLDAPCSATGILRRQPDGKWHKRESDITRLADLQKQLLDAIWPLLAPGGVLIYATCSIIREENDYQVAHFLERHADATETTPVFTESVKTLHGCQLLPRLNGWDGFFFSRLQKSK